MNALHDLFKTLRKQYIYRVLRLEPLAYVGESDSPFIASLRNAMTDDGEYSYNPPFFTFINEYNEPCRSMDPALAATLEEQINAVIGPLAGSHFDLEQYKGRDEKDIPTHVMTEVDLNDLTITDTYTSFHLSHTIHRGSPPFNNDLFPQLKDLGVSEIHVKYIGHEDSGELTEVSCVDSNSKEVPIEKMPFDADFRGNEDTYVEVLIKDFLYMTLGALVRSWGNWRGYKGSHGELTVSVETGEIQINHYENLNETESVYSEIRDCLITTKVYDRRDEVDVIKFSTPKM